MKFNGDRENQDGELELPIGEEKIFSVSFFLDLLNIGLKRSTAKIRGEVSGVTERGGNYYFNLKDQKDGSCLNCIVWKSTYRLFDIKLEDGQELIVHGYPSIYKPNGRLSFSIDALELVGDGALQKQYAELKKKLELEGLFASDRKKELPTFPEKIGLITSREGEAIHDFLTNLGRFGFKIEFYDSRVEGSQAVSGLLKAVKYFKNKDIDVLVLVRGGGSLESLLSFNNETLVRAIADFPKPVICGIGHERDVSLVDLAADRSTSTPTGAAKLLSFGWEQAAAEVHLAEHDLNDRFRAIIARHKFSIEEYSHTIRRHFAGILGEFENIFYGYQTALKLMTARIQFLGRELGEWQDKIKRQFGQSMKYLIEYLAATEREITLYSPERQLKLGYSIARQNGAVLKSVTKVSQGDQITVQLADGEILAEAESIRKSNQ